MSSAQEFFSNFQEIFKHVDFSAQTLWSLTQRSMEISLGFPFFETLKWFPNVGISSGRRCFDIIGNIGTFCAIFLFKTNPDKFSSTYGRRTNTWFIPSLVFFIHFPSFQKFLHSQKMEACHHCPGI